MLNLFVRNTFPYLIIREEFETEKRKIILVIITKTNVIIV